MDWVFASGVFILISLFCGPGEAVQCYLCSTQTKDNNESQCLYPESYRIPRTRCDQKALENTRHYARMIDPSYDEIFKVDISDMAKHMDLNCLKVSIRKGEKLYTFRGCQLAEQDNLDICFKLKEADNEYLKKQHCSRCSMDGCNAASKLLGQKSYYLSTLVLTVFIYGII